MGDMHPMIHPLTLHLPGLAAELEGLRAVHLTDLHITRPRRRHDALVGLVRDLQPDLILLTGDYMTDPGDEAESVKVMRRLCDAFQARHGVFGVFGNHDTRKLRRQLADFPVHWLNNQTHRLPGLPMEITGMETLKFTWPDSVAMLGQHRAVPGEPRPVRLMLCHHPTYLPTAADLGFDLMLSGHTHGGQCRLPGKRALLNSTDYPMHLTAGVLRHRDTLGLVSRGLGEVHLPWRLFCPPHVPVYTFRRGPLMGESTHHIHNAQPW